MFMSQYTITNKTPLKRLRFDRQIFLVNFFFLDTHSQIMPINKKTPLTTIYNNIQRLTYTYIWIDGLMGKHLYNRMDNNLK